MQKGNIGVTTENIFPIIKKFLYSDHEIFLRELVSNAVDATQKLRTLASTGEYKGNAENLRVSVAVDEKNKTITVSDNGIGMTAEEVNKYINQIAFSSAGEFLDKYKDQANGIIGHFGLGFYSAFMVSEKVEIRTLSYKEGSTAVHWECDGSPEYTLEDDKKETVGTDIILHIDDDSKDFASENRVKDLLNKYCKFLPVEIVFGKEKEWKDDKYVDTDKDLIINNTKPAWTRKPSELKEEDYTNFYRELYPMSEEPQFYIHLNVDYPFNLTGILYFPKVKSNIELQRNKIQLYCNQVYVTDSVEGIVPDFLTLLHGVIDSPDIPLNVSRSYLQSDSNVKKISAHITKKVADRLQEIFKADRKAYEEKWDNLKLFIEYGMVSEEKFYEKAEKFALLKNTEGKYFTFEEYEKLIEGNQKDKNKKLVYLYATNVDSQHSFIDAARGRGYDVLVMDGQLDIHYINHLESKFKEVSFKRVDADVIDKLIEKEEVRESKLSGEQQELLRPVFQSVLPSDANYYVSYENLTENDAPLIITQNEFMRRMKDMSALGGGPMNFYGQMPDSYNLVVNTNHPVIGKIADRTVENTKSDIEKIDAVLDPVEVEHTQLEKANEKKKPEEISQADKDKLEELNKKLEDLRKQRESILESFGKKESAVKQLVDLALLSNGMLKGADLSSFVQRSYGFIDVK
jgi:molecular chaperone HtpG